MKKILKEGIKPADNEALKSFVEQCAKEVLKQDKTAL